ncbi:MAG: hypothetical protein H0A75_03385 [Candidatus Methanofishera endochildressiae]|uniref:Uncharacterized protein n=1 Tax=Candidatus Methanofishera endochildressiae TaxID=2738884 RepID=A0A7Z0MNQ4_9GAMM|nr:hypothetical protein [Candidatus Methanofishera endochildressiae]
MVLTPANLWDIRFHMDGAEKIDLTYRKPTGTTETPYDYDTDLGFHFEDVEGTWRPIVGVTVSTPFAPKGFDPSLVKFDENNIYVNLKGSSCVSWCAAFKVALRAQQHHHLKHTI